MITQTIRVRVGTYVTPPVIHAVQNDSGRVLVFELADFTLASGDTAYMLCKRPSGTLFSYTGTIGSNNRTVSVEMNVDGGALTQVGNVDVQIAIIRGNLIVKTFKAIIAVEPDLSGASTPEDIEGGGLSNAAKIALLNCFANVAWINEDGQQYYDALYDALYPETPPAQLVSITADFAPTETIYDNATLDDLKQFLTVTANYDDGTEVEVSDYTLSGTLEIGTSTITVTYNELTTTFIVTVVGLVSITATYTQPGIIYDNETLDSLKDNLVVTANYSDSSTETLQAEDYTLSGTLTVGTSTITVSYGGQTDTFNVTVTSYLDRMSYSYANGDLIKVSAALNTSSGPLIDYDYASRRRTFVLDYGDEEILNYHGGTSTGYYAIPVPTNATSVTVSITPNTQFTAIVTWLNRQKVADSGWKSGTNTLSFAAGSIDNITINCKYNSTGNSYPTEPTDLTITFA